jgi:hypothetical protein
MVPKSLYVPHESWMNARPTEADAKRLRLVQADRGHADALERLDVE